MQQALEKENSDFAKTTALESEKLALLKFMERRYGQKFDLYANLRSSKYSPHPRSILLDPRSKFLLDIYSFVDP